MTRASPLSLVVLISGRGSNLQAIIEAIRSGSLAADIRAVISNKPDAAGLLHAHKAGIPTQIIDHRLFADRTAFDTALRDGIDRYQPDLVVLAGFMRLLTPEFVAHFAGRMINIHPSLLPRYPGLDTHRQALAAGDREHGASVHFVTADMDGGPVIARIRVPIHKDDTAATLAARVLEQEHRLYPEVLRWFATGRVRLQDRQIMLDGRAQTQPCRIDQGKGEREKEKGKE